MTEFTQNIRAVASAAHEDMQTASLRDKLGFYATSLGLAAHQVGMEGALFIVGTNAYVAGHETVGIAAPLVVAAANGLFSLGVETALTTGTSRGLTTFSGATNEIKDRFILADEPDEDVAQMLEHARDGKRGFKDKADTALVALSIGSAATVLMDYAKHPEDPIETHKKLGITSARALGGFNAALGLAIGAGIYASEELGTDAVYNSVEYLSDSPYTYAAFVSLVGIRLAFAARNHRKKRQAQSTDEQ